MDDEEKLVCSNCGGTDLDPDDTLEVNEKYYCEMCVSRHGGAIECHLCDDLMFRGNGFDYRDEDNEVFAICEDCTDEIHRCEGCGVFTDELVDDVYCSSCSDRISGQEHDFKASDALTDNPEPGKIARSLRKFGVEVEFLCSADQGRREITKVIDSHYGVVHDGSIESGEEEYTGIEVVTPPMIGKAGELSLQKTLEAIKKLDVKVNSSCGMHVHLDSQGFLEDEEVLIKDAKKTKEAQAKQLDEIFSAGKGYTFMLVEKEMFVAVKKSYMQKTGSHTAQFIKKLHDDPNKKFDKLTLPRRGYSVYYGALVSIPTIRLESEIEDVKKLKKEADEIHSTRSKEGVTDSQRAKSLKKMQVLDVKRIELRQERDKITSEFYLIAYPKNRTLNRLKALLYLHSVYGDVFLAMLPNSRRSGNRFCSKLSMTFAPNDILAIKSLDQFEALWYKTSNKRQIEKRKDHKYDDSRYYNVNFHSLYGHFKTIEIRQHSATLDLNKILLWVAIHQEIMDKIATEEVTIAHLTAGADLFSVEEKTEYLLKTLNLRSDLTRYIKTRIKHFSKK